MRTIERTIEVDRPVSAVYDQWRRFQDFPLFMEGIREVRLTDDKHQSWKAVIGGKALAWDAEIVEQVPGQRLGWRSTRVAHNSGTLTFIALTPAKTRVILYLAYDPKGLVEKLGDNLGLVSARVAGDLNRFKKFIESRGAPVQTRHRAEIPLPACP